MNIELAYSIHLGNDKNKTKRAKEIAKNNPSNTTSFSNNSIQNSKGKVTTKTYGSASSALFAEENNFATNDNLSAITKNNLIPTALEKISSTNFENLMQENNLITYSEK